MKNLIALIFAFGITFSIHAQTDSLILKNKDVIIGEIKSMDRGVLTIETDYSDSDFKISWDGIAQLYSNTKYLITLSNGKRYNGKVNSVGDGVISIDTYDPDNLLPLRKKRRNTGTEDIGGGTIEVDINEIVYLNALDEGFWSRLSANIDLGWSLTKANNLRQFNIRSGLGYLADRWKANGSYNSLRSTQDEIDPVKRTDADFNFNFFLPKDWYLLYNITFLSNTEQLIKLRTGNKIGIGNYLVHNNKSYFGFQVGVNYNNERYFDDTPSRRTGEGFVGAELNMYDIGDLSLFSQVVAYPSFSESGRFRTDFKMDVKYEFFSDFYVKLGTTMNYDNRPIEGATTLDYIFQTTVGWEL
ncbi:DUF481 domain-containing protein [Algoriphagus lutimaris]|uniref:DUF481 domain-containing protein n=1 Tax=Algoriphagus lutimaris TaxID=613197 RepID=UPI00196A9EA3|nr:DUF481 domain-containing protein [Algoriphagus lutimaris]MBN3521436.1 DUF481 domain-containing protein [Algoriphagus lutimaris]